LNAAYFGNSNVDLTDPGLAQ